MDPHANFVMPRVHAIITDRALLLEPGLHARAVLAGQALLAIHVLPITTDLPANIAMQTHAAITGPALLLAQDLLAHAAQGGQELPATLVLPTTTDQHANIAQLMILVEDMVVAILWDNVYAIAPSRGTLHALAAALITTTTHRAPFAMHL
jgi:hypothetical protein